MTPWGSAIEREVKRRIKITVAAYAYEFKDAPIMSDAEYDKLSNEICPDMDTGNKVMDAFFAEHFDPSTGQWVRRHPDLDRVRFLYSVEHLKRPLDSRDYVLEPKVTRPIRKFKIKAKTTEDDPFQ